MAFGLLIISKKIYINMVDHLIIQEYIVALEALTLFRPGF